MRQAYSNQLRLDTVPIPKVELNLQCRDRIVPVLRALQHVYSHSEGVQVAVCAVCQKCED